MNYFKKYKSNIRVFKLVISTDKTILSILVMYVLLTLNSCVRKEIDPDFYKYSDLEILTKDGKKFVANNDSNYAFNNGNYQTAIMARSGKYSVLSSPKNPFVLSVKLPYVYRDSYVDVSIWKKGQKTHLVCVLEGMTKYYTTDKVVETDIDGWEKLNLTFHVPPVNDYYKLKFYLWNSGKDTVYYDDIELRIIRNEKFPEYTMDAFHLEMDTSEIIKLMNTRKRAFSAGVLQSVDDDWVKGFVFSNGKMMKAKLRLKGDWLDHLHGYKWSYRVKLKKGNTWNHMKVFSVQNPMARMGVNEWFLHSLMISEGLLTTRYGFTPLTLNGKSMGLYAWEEHFVKQLVESQKRREGPMLRFVEDALWDSRVLNEEGKMNEKKTPVFDVSVIKPFSTGKTIEDTSLFNQFLIAQNLMFQYKKRLRPASEIFDIRKMAQYFAIADVFMARHGIIWHNQRFYYNPVTCKLEPIAYDCYSDIGLDDHIKNPITGFLHSDMTQPDEYLMVRELFNDTAFVNYYVNYMETYSDSNFLDSLYSGYGSQINYYDSLIVREYSQQSNFENKIKLNAQTIRSVLPAYRNQISEMRKHNRSWVNTTMVRNDYDTVLPDFFAPNLILVYKQRVVGDSVLLKVKNYFTESIAVMGVGKANKKIREVIVPVPQISGSRNGKPVESSFWISNDKVNYLFFTIDDSYDMMNVEINQWPEPNGKPTPLQQLTYSNIFPDTSIIAIVEGENVFIKNKKIILNHTVVIPAGYILHFKAGTTIDLINNAAFISSSTIRMHGEADNQIIITSSDFTGNGFVVLQANERSEVKNVVFENLNTLNYNGWILTGAVTFYESDVTITNTSFYRNQSEDALNIVRSEFTLKNSTFDYIYGDAFDGDFCTGLVLNTKFTNIGNDALDFSGSDITIENTTVDGAEDKGISGGENSRVSVINTTITRSNIGIASKDMSIVEVLDSKIEECNYGFVLLQKKPEFGPSTIVLDNIKPVNCKINMLIEENSKVIDGNDTIRGAEKNVSEIFY